MMLTPRTIRITGAALTAIFVSAASAETATAPNLGFTMSVGNTTSTWQDSFGVSPDATLWSYSGEHSNSNGSVSYSVSANPDPILGFDFSFENLTATTQDFFVLLTLPVTPWNGTTLIGASIGGSVTDANNDGIGTLSTIGVPVFDGLIDGSSWLTLFDSPFTASVPFSGGTEIVGPDTDGLPGPSNPGPGTVNSTISVVLNFSLTGGDRAAFTGVFIVEYSTIPAPAGALVLLGLAGTRRRRD